MAPRALLLRCIDFLYILNLPDPMMHLLSGLFGLAVRVFIVVLTIYHLLAQSQFRVYLREAFLYNRIISFLKF